METLKSLFQGSSQLDWPDWNGLMVGTNALDGFDFTKAVLFRPSSNSSQFDSSNNSTSSCASSDGAALGLSSSGTQTALS